jgi:peptide/nickel transport system substrate-binding protein
VNAEGPRFARRTLLGALLTGGAAQALGRTPVGGVLRLVVPYALDQLDPHAANDPFSALFAPAIAETLFARAANGQPYPTLALGVPEVSGSRLKLKLRPALVTAAGKRLDARDVIFSLTRARSLGGAALLGAFPPPTLAGKDNTTLHFDGIGAADLADALASPTTAIVPRGFSPTAPDGAGAFSARLGGGTLVLSENPLAARGAAFLDRIEVRSARDLSDSLRAFETGQADVGWLGAGLYRPRPSSVRFQGETFGWIVLRTGNDAGRWGAPGIAQELLDRIPRERLSHLGLVLPAQSRRSSTTWGGGAAELLVRDGSAQLVQTATTLASLLSVAGHVLTPRPLGATELDERRKSGRYVLMLDFVRAVGPPGKATLLALLAAARPELTSRPPKLPSHEPEVIARTLPLGIVGGLRVEGAHLPELHGLASFQLGGLYIEPQTR